MDSLPSRVQHAITRAGVTVEGVSCPHPTNKATWRIDHLATATEADRATAAAVVMGFSEADPAVLTADKDREADRIDGDLLIQAVAQLDYEERQKLTVKAGQTLRSAAECKARVRAIYRALLP